MLYGFRLPLYHIIDFLPDVRLRKSFTWGRILIRRWCSSNGQSNTYIKTKIVRVFPVFHHTVDFVSPVLILIDVDNLLKRGVDYC